MPRRIQRNPTARQHAEWLSLLDTSGPFLSIEVLLATFPNGLDADDSDLRQLARLAYEEWLDNQGGVRPNPAVHEAWVLYVLKTVLGFADERILRGDKIPADLRVRDALHGEEARPDFVIGNAGEPPRLVVLVEPRAQKLDKSRPSSASTANPTDRLIAFLRAVDLPLGIVTNGSEWRLVYAPRNVTSSLATWYAELWFEEPLTLRAFRSLLHSRRVFGMSDDQQPAALLARSVDSQQEVTTQLGSQVRSAVEQLVQAIDLANRDTGGRLLADVPTKEVYRAATTIMMRLVFLFSAEERGFFPLDDELYLNNYAATPLREQLRKFADDHTEEAMERRSDAWRRLLATFRAIHNGVAHDRLRLPAYGGALFDPDTYPFLEGRSGTSWWKELANPLPINNRVMLHVLESLQLLQVEVPGGGKQMRRLSYRGLDVEQIGDVYEGLLDHTAKVAQGVVLGLAGTQGKEPEVALSTLEERAGRRDDLVGWLREQTNRSVNALSRALDEPLDFETQGKVRAACGNDEKLFERVLPYAGLLRADAFDRPVVILPGSLYVTQGSERRSSGTHYTPRALAEPIVQHTLEPLVYVGPAEGKLEAEWQLKTPQELLALKICDMAMGSGAFLVAVVRYMAERVVEAWRIAEERLGIDGKRTWLTQEGERTRNHNDAIPTGEGATDERLGLARRLVAERCIYGVDKNADAVELAKLSLWLITLDRHRPFTFVDHALKSGDSLVGIHTLDQLRCWNLEGSGERTFGTVGIDLDIAAMIKVRQEIEARVVVDVQDQQIKALMLADAEAKAHDLKAAADCLIASYYNTLNRTQQATLRRALLSVARDGASLDAHWQPYADLGDLKPFHWPLEFPEVFVAQGREGFDAFVGNPPFLGGMRISTTFGRPYLDLIQSHFQSANGTADLCAYFFVRGFVSLANGGSVGLIATNTIGQGDTRLAGLEFISANGGTIYFAITDMPWPGNAAVAIAVVVIRKGGYVPPLMLDGEGVSSITTLLDDQNAVGTPFALCANENTSYIGSYVLGMGFVLESEEANSFLNENPRATDVVFPYLNAEDLNTSPTLSASRHVINFFDWPRSRSLNGSWNDLSIDEQQAARREGEVPLDYPGRVAADYEFVFSIVRERVFPERSKVNRESNRKYWWQYGEKRPALYGAIAGSKYVLVCPIVSKYVSFAWVPGTWVYAHRLVVFAYCGDSDFAILQSNIHEAWARKYSSTLETRINYSPSDVFETFAIPKRNDRLAKLGMQTNHSRQDLMLSRNEGLTATYNRFHDPHESSEDIAHLRALHVEMDNAVAAAYGWQDLELGHGFRETPQGVRYALSDPARREVLRRLLALNHERYAEEVAQGLHEKKKASRGGKGAKKLRANKDQLSLGMDGE